MYRSLILIAFVLPVTVGLSQQQTPPANNSNSNSNTNIILNSNSAEPAISEEFEEPEVDKSDTTQIEVLKEQESKKKERGVKSSVRSVQYKSEDEKQLEAIPVESESIEESTNADFDGEGASETLKVHQHQQATYGFSYAKDQSAQQRMQRTPSAQQQQEMDEAVGYFEANAPNSFEHHYFKYVSGNYDVSLVSHLRKAETIRPGNTDVKVQMAAYHIINRETDSAATYVNAIMESGRLEQNVIHYGTDILASVPKNGVLITHGFDDTYSVWKKQQIDGMRKDVKLISLDFMQSEHYRKLLLADGFKLPAGTTINVDYLKEFCALNASKNLSISMTTPKEYFVPIQSKLYVTGLVFEYHEDEFNNFERNDKLWNEVLSKHLVDNATDEKSKQLSANYLPMILQLRKVYGQQGEEKKVNEMDAAADKVSLQCKKYEQVQQLKKSY